MTPPPTDAAPSKGLWKLAVATAVLTFALVVVGGIVRVSDSGLGCGPAGSGAEGWPLCGGRVVPLIDTEALIEYAHRVLAGVVAVLMGVLALLAWRRHPKRRALVRVSVGAFALVVLQAALGGLTVEKGLSEELVAAHLGVASAQLGLLMIVARLSRPGSAEEPRSAPATATRGMGALATAASIAVLAAVVAGGYMSASGLHGTSGPVRQGAHVACGTDFPSCRDGFLPFGANRELNIHLTHRLFVYVAFALILLLAVAVARRRRSGRLSGSEGDQVVRAVGVLVAILIVQVLLGALNVWLGAERAWLVVAHLAIGVLLWSALVWVSLLVLGVREPAPATARHDAEVEALPA